MKTKRVALLCISLIVVTAVVTATIINKVKFKDDTKPSSVSGNNINEDSVLNNKVFELESGEKVTFYLPEGHFDTTESLYEMISDTYGVNVSSTNIFYTGNAETMFGSEQAINCCTYTASSIIMSAVAGEDTPTTGSTAYNYMVTGNLNPDERFEADYSLTELEPIVVDDITYHVYNVSYTIPGSYTDENGEEVDAPTFIHCLQVYSNTEDTIEICVYTGDFNEETALDLLHQFLGV